MERSIQQEQDRRKEDFYSAKVKLEGTIKRLNGEDVNNRTVSIDYGALWRMAENNDAWYKLVPLHAVETDFDFVIGVLRNGYFNLPFKAPVHRTIYVLEGTIDNQGTLYSRGQYFDVAAEEFVQTKAIEDSILMIQVAQNGNQNRILKVLQPGPNVVTVGYENK